MTSSKSNLTSWLVFVGLFGLAVAAGVWMLSGSAVHAEKGDQVEATAGDEKVLAIVGDSEITQSQVEEAVSGELFKLEQQRHQLMESGVDRLVNDKLLELGAAARGISTDELMQQEVQAKAPEPTQGEIDAFYESNKARIRQTKEEVEGQIRQYLKQQKQQGLVDALLADLSAELGVTRHLEPMRIQVASEGFPSKGPAEAPVTIVEFSDFECPYCSRVVPTLDQVVDNYGEQVRLVFRQFPLRSIHPNAQKAAEASLCAARQGKFWEMHDAMFGEQRSLTVAQLKEKASRIGLDTEAFNGCLDSGQTAPQVASDLAAGSEAGVTGTPAIFINGRFLSGAQPYADIARLIDEELERTGERVN